MEFEIYDFEDQMLVTDVGKKKEVGLFTPDELDDFIHDAGLLEKRCLERHQLKQQIVELSRMINVIGSRQSHRRERATRRFLELEQ